MDANGRIMKKIVKKGLQAGAHTIKMDVHDLKTGFYVCEFKAGIYKETKKLIIAK
jgi:hypothetical protein